MSRAPINAAVSEIGRQMDMMTIDPNCLRIPYKNKKSTCPPVNNYPVISLVSEKNEHSNNIGQPSGEITVEIRRTESPIADFPEKAILSISGCFVIAGYVLFSLSLALCNLFLKTSSASPLCILASPVAMLSLTAHAFSMQPLSMGVGLLISAWVLPTVCSMWSTAATLYYIAFLGISLGLAHWRFSGLFFLVPLALFVFLSSTPMVVYHGVESQWGISVSVFLVTLLGVFSSRHLALVKFRLRALV